MKIKEAVVLGEMNSKMGNQRLDEAAGKWELVTNENGEWLEDV